MKINNRLKKMAGEDLAKFLARNFQQEKVAEIICQLFNNNGKDVKKVKKEDYPKLKKILNEQLCSEQKLKKSKGNIKHPDDILKAAGYSLFKSETFADFDQFERYFERNERLCKFNDSSRAKRNHVFWIVKDNADKIKRSETPTRQDEYSTSVCSIQISKDGRNVTQITSRYNHTVPGCDNTFNSNLNEIAKGLTQSFNKHFGFTINESLSIELDSFVFFDKKYCWYRREINGVKFGDNTIISNKLMNYSPDSYYIYDYFLINLKTKKIEWDDKMMDYRDGFVDVFNSSVKKIEFVKDIDEVDDNDSDEICYIQR